MLIFYFLVYIIPRLNQKPGSIRAIGKYPDKFITSCFTHHEHGIHGSYSTGYIDRVKFAGIIFYLQRPVKRKPREQQAEDYDNTDSKFEFKTNLHNIVIISFSRE